MLLFYYLPTRLNVHRSLGTTCYRWPSQYALPAFAGVDDQVFKFNNTCYPHAIGIGATWDKQLITEISQITAIEARVLEGKYWDSSGGKYIGKSNHIQRLNFKGRQRKLGLGGPARTCASLTASCWRPG